MRCTEKWGSKVRESRDCGQRPSTPGAIALGGREAAWANFSKTCACFRAASAMRAEMTPAEEVLSNPSPLPLTEGKQPPCRSRGALQPPLPSAVPAGSTPSAEPGHRPRAPSPLVFFLSHLRLLLPFSARQSRIAIDRQITRVRG